MGHAAVYSISVLSSQTIIVEHRCHTSMMHDNDPGRLDDRLHDRDGPNGVRYAPASITDHSRICKSTSDRSLLDAIIDMILIISSNPKILSSGTLGSAQEITMPPCPDARVFGAISNMSGEG